LSEEEQLPCRLCNGTLEEVVVAKRSIWMCRGCGSALVERTDLIPVLEVAAREIASQVSYDTEIIPIPQPGTVPCPDCDKMMDSFGYMETNLVYPWRCYSCALVYMGADVMGTMTLLFARTNFRHDAFVSHMQEELASMDRRMSAVLMNRIREGWMMMGA